MRERAKDNSLNLCTIKSFDELLSKSGESYAIGRIYDENNQFAFLVLTSMLSGYLSFVNAKQSINAEQTTELINIILTDFRQLTIDEFNYFFYKCKRGHYGNDYNRICPVTIITWLQKFCDELEEHWNMKKQEEEQRIKEEMKESEEALFVNCPDDVQRGLNKMFYGMSCTDDELKEKQRLRNEAHAIRNQIVKQNLHRYSEKKEPIEEIDRDIDIKVKDALINKGLFEYL